MVVGTLTWTTLGFVLGMAIALYVLPRWERARENLLKAVLSTNRDLGWLWIQEGTNYTLAPVSERNGDTLWVDLGDEARAYDDDAGLMHSFMGIPIGFVVEPHRPVADLKAAEAGTALETKADGGELQQNDTLTRQEIKNRLITGYERGDENTMVYVNPFEKRPDTPKIMDLRPIVQTLRHAGKSDTPRKAAQNAKAAERAFDRFGEFKQNVMLLAAFILGAITVEFIAGSGGGGGGGGGIDVPMPFLYVPDIISLLPF